MKSILTIGPVACGSLMAGLLALSCAADKVTSPARDGGAGTGGRSSGGATGTGGSGALPLVDGSTDAGRGILSLCGGKTGTAQILCGEYLVRHIGACGDCHTPRDAVTGGPSTKPEEFLTGNPHFADVAPTIDGKGNIPTPNLTVLASNGWTKAEVKDAFLDGKRTPARGGGLFPIMPYFTLHNMAAADADAIATYLLGLKAAGAPAPAREPLPPPLDQIPFPLQPVPASAIPSPAATAPHQEEALLGKYLATAVGPCMECHTPRIDPGLFDSTRIFAGGQAFAIGGPFGTVIAANVTPAKDGIEGWTPEDVQKLILTGVTKAGASICPPMPAGPNGAFGQMDPAQALAIGYYLTSIPALENPADAGPFPRCTFPVPVPPVTDAGARRDAAAVLPDATIPIVVPPDAAHD